LLNERKQIVIQQAVTKGLDPNVKMKDSGVEWIGQIPEHWEVKKVKII
jgi:type I restriction enzyme S subunit